MTTMTLETTAAATRPTLEELVDRLLTALLGNDALADTTAVSLVKTVHEARRLRQSGDLEGALGLFTGVDTAGASDAELRWLYAEWLDIARRRFVDANATLYSPATGQAAALVPAGSGNGGTLEVVAILGMRWPVGKLVSLRSLRGLKPLHKQGGASWS